MNSIPVRARFDMMINPIIILLFFSKTKIKVKIITKIMGGLHIKNEKVIEISSEINEIILKLLK
ncbi:MAG: hypothetical protein PHY57_10670 [Ignavibacterium sp.]|nr:hypothetical protein [Ignavibacteriaceae bacterium]MDD5608967.1 hypothetical protein [Ignavibacterium sp.]GIK21230.1 MAG: hypothetical protein BroJett005_06440 [Ignavibacteriota bacterium]